MLAETLLVDLNCLARRLLNIEFPQRLHEPLILTLNPIGILQCRQAAHDTNMNCLIILIKLLGTMTDAAVGQLLGRPRTGVQRKRAELGIDPVGGPPQHAWTKAEIALLGRLPDGQLGLRIGLSRSTVMKKRRELGIAGWGRRP